MILYSLLFAMQAQSAAPAADPKPAAWPEPEREMPGGNRVGQGGNDRIARTTLEKLGECSARKSPGETARLLTMDFKSTVYDRGMVMLANANKQCAGFRGTLRSANLLFAGELAEAMLESDTTPLANRIAKAAAAPATESFSFTDKVAICVVRSVPNDVAALFATARDSAEETASLNGLTTAMGMCAKAAEARKPLSINPAGLRAMLATATFRSLESAKAI